MSTAGAECVSAPTDTKSAPVAASSGMRSSVTPPEISTFARPRARRTASRMSSSAQVVGQDDVRARRERLVDLARGSALRLRRAGPGCRARARATAASTPPASRTWLSLIRIASKRPTRWFVPPPAATAYFSSARSVGVVLRVSRTVMRPPAASTNCARPRGDARQPLEEVQRRALGRQQRARGAGDHRRSRRPARSGRRRACGSVTATDGSSCRNVSSGHVQAGEHAVAP